MNIIPTRLKEVRIIEPRVFGDPRGYFMETFQQQRYAEAGIAVPFVQDNISYSRQHTLRGLHYQHPDGQDKLVQVMEGEILDVAVDVRRGSPTFGRSATVILSAENHRQLFIPRGFAHGFRVLSATALFMYKCSAFYAPEHEGGIIWNDPDLDIEWPADPPLLSDKDRTFTRLRDIPPDRLPSYEA
jgi:dTDP-4-dehydrorhamnose 3,5-epimerase